MMQRRVCRGADAPPANDLRHCETLKRTWAAGAAAALALMLVAGVLSAPSHGGMQVAQVATDGQARDGQARDGRRRDGLARMMSAAEAHEKALSGKLVLIDIRSEAEWRETGVAASAVTVTMHQPARTFFSQLQAATSSRKSFPIALICATGSRTAHLQNVLGRYGYTSVINVAEGMLGSRHGSGWIKAGLPIRGAAR